MAGQTGNVVFLSVELINQETRGIEVKLATMLAFMLGIFLMTVFQHYFEHSWRRLSSVFPLILTTVIAGFLPANVPHLYIVPPLAFCMGLVATAFGEVDGIVYNNSFMTGNIKKTMVAFGNYARNKKGKDLQEGLFFVALFGKLCSRSHLLNLSDPILPLEDHLACFSDSNSLSPFPRRSVYEEMRMYILLRNEVP